MSRVGSIAAAIGRRAGLIVLVIVAVAVGFALKSGGSVQIQLATAQTATGPAGEATAGAPAQKEATVWTCSMHPWIRESGPGQCPICGMDLIPVSAASAAESGLRVLEVSMAARALMDVQTAPVERRFVEAPVRMVGQVAVDETRLREITAWIPGRLDRLYVDFTGIDVEKGDHMVDIYSPQLLAAQEELLQAIQASKELAKSDLGVVKSTTDATVQAARDRLRLWGLSALQIDRIEESGEASDHVTIYAPIGGTVVHKNATEGMYVQVGTPLYRIADLTQVWVMLDAYESDLEWLRYGQHVTITTEAYPGEEFKGWIAFIDPVVDSKTRTVKVRVNAENPEKKLKPDMFVRAVAHATLAKAGQVVAPDLEGKWVCRMHPAVVKDGPGVCDICGMPLVRVESLGYAPLTNKEEQKPLVIPASAPLVTGTRAVVYVELPDREVPTFEGREVVLGPRAGDYYIVRNGLQEGDIVVTRGGFKIDSALQIQAKPSMMSPAAGIAEGGQGAPAQPGTGTPPAEARARFVSQLQPIYDAPQATTKGLQAGDLAGARQTFQVLASAVGGVDAGGLSGEDLAAWRELSMLLGNDAVQGAAAKTAEDLRAALSLLNQHVGYLRNRFTVPAEKPAPKAAPAPVPPAPAAAPAGVPDAFRAELGAFFDAYVAVHAGLFKGDAAAAAAAAKEAEGALGKVDMELLSGDDHTAWMKQLADLRQGLEGVAGAKDLDAELLPFETLSKALTAALKRFGTDPARAVYRLHCPMAFGGRGADWLQLDTEVRNPWFGPKMPKCGSVVETIDTGAAGRGGTSR